MPMDHLRERHSVSTVFHATVEILNQNTYAPLLFCIKTSLGLWKVLDHENIEVRIHVIGSVV